MSSDIDNETENRLLKSGKDTLSRGEMTDHHLFLKHDHLFKKDDRVFLKRGRVLNQTP